MVTQVAQMELVVFVVAAELFEQMVTEHAKRKNIYRDQLYMR